MVIGAAIKAGELDHEEDEELETESATMFRSLAATLNCMNMDRSEDLTLMKGLQDWEMFDGSDEGVRDASVVRRRTSTRRLGLGEGPLSTSGWSGSTATR